jgi:hypothetical protein
MLLGRVVAAPRPGTGTAGGCVLFSVSTEGAGQDDAGQRHRVRVTGDQAAWCLARLRRGMLVHVEGELVACAHGGEAGAIVAAWLVQAVDDDRRSGADAHPAVRLEAPLSGVRRSRRGDRPVAMPVGPARADGGSFRAGWCPSVAVDPQDAAVRLRDGDAGDAPGMVPWSGGRECGMCDARPCPVPWGHGPDAAGGVPGRLSRRMH